MRNLHAILRSKRIKCLFGIVYHPRKNNRLERLKMKNPLSSQTAGGTHLIMKKNYFPRCKVKKIFSKNRRKLWKSHFFDYLCEKIKN